jgi:hypothetical protein
MDQGALFDRKEIARTVQFLSIDSEEPEHADAALVFSDQLIDSAHIAADLVKQGLVRYVLVRGAIKGNGATHSAGKHKSALLAEGVPADRIIVDNDVQDDGKEDTRSGIASIKSMIAIVEWYSCRRVVMSQKRGGPHRTRYFTRTFEPQGISRLDWHLHPALTKHVLEELDMVEELLGQGEIEDIEMVDGAWT